MARFIVSSSLESVVGVAVANSGAGAATGLSSSAAVKGVCGRSGAEMSKVSASASAAAIARVTASSEALSGATASVSRDDGAGAPVVSIDLGGVAVGWLDSETLISAVGATGVASAAAMARITASDGNVSDLAVMVGASSAGSAASDVAVLVGGSEGAEVEERDVGDKGDFPLSLTSVSSALRAGSGKVTLGATDSAGPTGDGGDGASAAAIARMTVSEEAAAVSSTDDGPLSAVSSVTDSTEDGMGASVCPMSEDGVSGGIDSGWRLMSGVVADTVS
jgi:hypothetical protein